MPIPHRDGSYPGRATPVGSASTLFGESRFTRQREIAGDVAVVRSLRDRFRPRRLPAASEFPGDAIQMRAHRPARGCPVVRGDRTDNQCVIVDRLPRQLRSMEMALDLREQRAAFAQLPQEINDQRQRAVP